MPILKPSIFVMSTAIAAVAVSLLAPAVSQPAAAAEVILNVWSRQDVSGPLRGGNLITAASRLNKALKKEGSDTTCDGAHAPGPGVGVRR